MLFSQLTTSFKTQKLAGCRYEKSGHGRFCDCISIYRNGKARFQRYCYGEAAGLVFCIWGVCSENDTIEWVHTKDSIASKEQIPTTLRAVSDNVLYFDGKDLSWDLRNSYKTAPEAGLNRFAMIFKK